MSKAVEKNWIRSTCRIITDGGSGTGFFLNDNKRKRIYLVTNKHVIHSYKKERNSIREVKLDINVIDNGGQTKSDEVLYSFRDGLYREHEDLDTDVYILDVTEMFATLLREHGIKPNHFAAPLDYLLTDEAMRRNEIKITDEVFLIGYPSTNNLQHHATNFPFVRQGIIASNIGDMLEDDFHGEELKEDKSKPNRRRVMKAFLIDGGIMPGLSGAPVILKPTMFRELAEGRVADTFPPLILGIVAETRMAFLAEHYGQTFYSYANLGLAFDAETITDTINLF